MKKKRSKEAFAYVRSTGKPSIEEQRRLTKLCVTRLGVDLVSEFADNFTDGNDVILGRSGFEALIANLEIQPHIKFVIIAEDECLSASALWRAVATTLIEGRGVRMVMANRDDPLRADVPPPNHIKAIGKAVADYERQWSYKKAGWALRARSMSGHKGGGRKYRYELATPEEVKKLRSSVKLAQRLRRRSPPMSYRQIADKLKSAGYLNARGEIYTPPSIKRMIEGLFCTGPSPRSKQLT
jgi:hypothetical protein